MAQDWNKGRQPIRVILFGGGPTLERGVKQFVSLLEDHPEIDFLGGFCQSEGHTFQHIFSDLWRRRRLLAFPLLISGFLSNAGHFISDPFQETKLRRKFNQIASRIKFVADIHAEAVLEGIRQLAPDLGLIYGSPILKPELFVIPAFGTLGIHHGKLPEYRGNKTTFWAMFNGESTAGVTIQKVNEGLDTGSIVKEGQVSIGQRSYQTVWRDLEALGLHLYIQAILEVKNGTAIYRKPSGEKGRLYRNPKPKDFFVFWIKQMKKRNSRT